MATSSGDASLSDKMFKDVRFWVALRIPMREYFINKIKECGGVIVPLEKQADMRIADHARKDAPAGSYSWKFIDDSIKHGIAQIKDRYAIGPDPHQARSRPVASAGPTRSGRVEFTPEDDAVLVKWVLSHNQHRTGNIIYQELENENPRHTWQSWQNRWRKKLQYYTQTQLTRIANYVPPNTQPQNGSRSPPPPPRQKPQRQPQPQQSEEELPLPRYRAAPAQSRPPPRAQKQPPARDAPSSPEAGPSQPPKRVQASAPSPKKPSKSPPKPHKPEPLSPDPAINSHESLPSEPPNDPIPEPSDSADPTMDTFYDDLNTYMNTVDSKINLNPIIGNRQFTIWDLENAVGSQDVDIEDVEWNQVADFLGYEDYDDYIPDQLQECWEENLRDFVNFMKDFDMSRLEPDPTADSGDEAISDAAREAEEGLMIPNTMEEDEGPASDEEPEEAQEDYIVAEAAEEYETAPQERGSDELSEEAPEDDIVAEAAEYENTEPQLPSLAAPSSVRKKRALDTTPLPSIDTNFKRRRLAPNAVIPSTPEHLLGFLTSVDGKTQPSPSVARSLRIQRLRHYNLDDTIKDSQDDTQDRLKSPPQQPATREPSPDLGSMEIRTPVLERIESAYDTTPSQQLERESEAGSSPFTARAERAPIAVVEDNDSDDEEDETIASPQQAATPQPKPAPLPAPKKRALPSSFRNSTDTSIRHPAPQPEPARRHSITNNNRRTSSHGNPPPSMTRQPSSIPQWVEHYESLGYPRTTVNKAMLATTMNPGTLVTTVLESLARGTGIPPNIAGIWTDRDDRALRHVLAYDLDRDPLDAADQLSLKKALREERRLLNKHGELWMDQRKQFLADKAALEERRRRREGKMPMRTDGIETSM